MKAKREKKKLFFPPCRTTSQRTLAADKVNAVKIKHHFQTLCLHSFLPTIQLSQPRLRFYLSWWSGLEAEVQELAVFSPETLIRQTFFYREEEEISEDHRWSCFWELAKWFGINHMGFGAMIFFVEKAMSLPKVQPSQGWSRTVF